MRCGAADILRLHFNEGRYTVMASVIQYILYLAVLVLLAIPLGAYIKRVMYGEKTLFTKILTPCENLVYKVMRVDKEEQMSWKKYLLSVLIFNGIGLVFLFLLQLLQGVLPGNPQGLSGVKWDLSFNTAVSFITNTNWQAYSGESTLSYLTQALGLTVQNFVSAATGIAVLFALIRGFVKVSQLRILLNCRILSLSLHTQRGSGYYRRDQVL